MGKQVLLDRALTWLSRHADRDGRLTVALRRRTSNLTHRYVMLLLVAGFLQPITVTRKDSSSDQIVYAVTENSEESHPALHDKAPTTQNR
jgi:hypothetical protein